MRVSMTIRVAAVLCGLLIAGAATAREVVIGAEDDWLPYAGLEDGAPHGLGVDLVRAALRAAGVRHRLEPLPYARCMALTRSGRLDGCFNTSRDASLEADFLWHATPLYRARILVFAPAARPAPARPLGVTDLLGRRVAVTNGYTYGDEFDLAAGIQRQVAGNDLGGLRMLLAGRADYALVFEQVARHLEQRHRRELGGRIRPVGFIKEMALYVSFSRARPDSPDVVAAFNRGMDAIARDGTRARIEQTWQHRLSARTGGP